MGEWEGKHAQQQQQAFCLQLFVASRIPTYFPTFFFRTVFIVNLDWISFLELQYNQLNLNLLALTVVTIPLITQNFIVALRIYHAY